MTIFDMGAIAVVERDAHMWSQSCPSTNCVRLRDPCARLRISVISRVCVCVLCRVVACHVVCTKHTYTHAAIEADITCVNNSLARALAQNATNFINAGCCCCCYACSSIGNSSNSTSNERGINTSNRLQVIDITCARTVAPLRQLCKQVCMCSSCTFIFISCIG